MCEGDSAWSKKGGTLSDKSARKEFGLSQQDIVEAIREGKLQYRENNVFGNPYLRLLRHEVEALVEERYGDNHLKTKQFKNELAQINKELRKLKAQMASLEQRRSELLAMLGE